MRFLKVYHLDEHDQPRVGYGVYVRDHDLDDKYVALDWLYRASDLPVQVRSKYCIGGCMMLASDHRDYILKVNVRKTRKTFALSLLCVLGVPGLTV